MISDSLSKATWKENFPPLVIVSGLVLGVAAAILVKLGNPGNMGFCIACFERDIAGALGLHQAKPVQYLRPEILGIVLGAAIAALMGKEFAPRSGSAPVVKFLLGVFMMIGGLVFLGCPTRMVLRLGGGDGNALLGLAGFTTGITIGVLFLRKGTSLGRYYKEQHFLSSWILPLLAAVGAVYGNGEPFPAVDLREAWLMSESHGAYFIALSDPEAGQPIFLGSDGAGGARKPYILNLLALLPGLKGRTMPANLGIPFLVPEDE